ncbi:hypothetical protein PR048_027958 [Dryococelus australis]|uniref:DUF7869 domain-containing protein n=1 Tax=Dryococelus australis TaxID=614101 RepID=A0ABQ9GI01_9NEOP|nr:hypothetical protein PR048_027958 [Dryococelus australis]
MFLERNVGIEVSYEKFRVPAQNYNFSFGYPRTHTCSTCDAYKAQEADIETLKANATYLDEMRQLEDQLRSLHIEMELHKRQAGSFYREKRLASKQTRKVKEFEAITMDYGKNLPIPNISTGDVYYKRQFSFYQFNVHVLSGGSSTFYSNDQTIAKKGSDEVASVLYNFFFEVLSSDVLEIHIFCDSYGGQNKNWTVIRFLHYVAVVLKRFDKVQVTYPIRGHSYMECDKNAALISQKTPAETPGDWREAIASARVKPSPFQVVKCQTGMFRAWEKALNQNYSKKFAAETRPIKQLIFKAVQHRETYNGAFSKIKKPQPEQQPHYLQEVELEQAYSELIPLSKEKFKDLQSLKRFSRQEAQDYFDSIPALSPNDDNTQERDSDF